MENLSRTKYIMRLIALLAILMMVFGVFSATAISAQGQGGNEDCPPGTVLVAKYDWESETNSDTVGSYVFDDEIAGTSDVIVFTNSTALEVNWDSGVILISAIVVKGGPDATIETVNPPATSGSFTNANLPPVGVGNIPAISNLKFCQDENPPEEPDLRLNLTAECVVGDTLYWRVTNDNDVDIAFTWNGPGANDGAGTATANDRTYFTTQDAGGANTTIINWTNPAGSPNSKTKAHNNQPCVYHVTFEKVWDGGDAPDLDGATILTATSSLGTATCTSDDGVLTCTYTTGDDLPVPFGETYDVTETGVAGWVAVQGIGTGFTGIVDFDQNALPDDLVYVVAQDRYCESNPNADFPFNLEKFCTHTVVNQPDEPEVTPDTTPEVTPDTTPDITPEVTPDTTPEVTPDTTPDITPEVTPDTTPEVTPDTTPEATPDTSTDDGDDDGIPDDQDRCEGFDDNVDADGDSIPDGCDDLIDSDGDGVADAVDTCQGQGTAGNVDASGCPLTDPDNNNPNPAVTPEIGAPEINVAPENTELGDASFMVSVAMENGQAAPTFLWADNGASWYGIVITDVSVTNFVIGTAQDVVWVEAAGACADGTCVFVPDNTQLAPDTLINGSYTWWLGSYDDATTKIDWVSYDFSVGLEAPAVPSVSVSPSGSQVTVSWPADNNAAWYELYIGGMGGWASAADLCDASTCSFTSTLSAGSYDLWARAWGAGGFSDWIGPIGFNVSG